MATTQITHVYYQLLSVYNFYSYFKLKGYVCVF